jgi:hypothetical protein
MNKFIAGFLLLLALLGTCAFIAYQYYLPKLVAQALVEEGSSSSYIPQSVQERIDRYREPINNGADKVVRQMHHSGIPLSTVLREIDNVDAQDIQLAVDEITQSNPKNTNEVFNILKRNINTNLDIEPLRHSFNANVNMKMVHNAIAGHEQMNLSDEVSLQLFKNVTREILIRKEQLYLQNQRQSKLR